MTKLTKIALTLSLLLFVTTVAIAQTVYVTSTGAKYHRGSCRYLHSSKIPMSLADAKESYTACSVCQPPTVVTERETNDEDDGTDTTEESATPQTPPGRSSSTTVPQKSQTPIVSKARQCSAYTKSGLRCKRTTTSASGKCWQHE